MFNPNVARGSTSVKLDNGRFATNLVWGDKLVAGKAINDKGGTSIYRWCAKTGIAVDGDHSAGLVTSSGVAVSSVKYANRYRNGLGSKRFDSACDAEEHASDTVLETVKLTTYADGSVEVAAVR